MILGILVFVLVVTAFIFSCSLVHIKFMLTRRDSIISTSIFTTLIYYIVIEFCSLFNAVSQTSILIISTIYIVGIFMLYTKVPKSKRFSFFRLSFNKDYLLYFLIAIAILIFITGCLYPPANWDSLSYHLPRIEHWIQNKNINFYETFNDRQLFSAPLAELLILPIRLITESDYLSFSVQWIAYIGSLLVISNISKQLNLTRRQQLYACCFFATLPIAILEASSTQNDLVVCFWILCSIDRMFNCFRKKTLISFAEFGVSIGLAILTKGTAYLILGPIVLYFAYRCIKNYKSSLKRAFFVAFVVLSINVPHYCRNYEAFKNPIESNSETKSNFTVKSFFYSFAGNIYSQLPIPLSDPSAINEQLSKVEKKIFPYGSFNIYSTKQLPILKRHLFTFHEDTVRNPLHTLLIIVAIFVILFNVPRIRKLQNDIFIYLLLFIAVFLFFCLGIPWQPWITRLQTPIFAIFAPLFGFTLMLISKQLRSVILSIMCVFALLPIFFNYTRPLKSIGRGIPNIELSTSYKSFMNKDRFNLYFYSELLTSSYINNLDIIVANQPKKIDLVTGYDNPEYFVWSYLRSKMDQPCFINVVKDTTNFTSDYVFIMDKGIIEKNAKKWNLENKDNIECLTLEKINNVYQVVK